MVLCFGRVTRRYKEEVFIMEEQSNDSIPVAVGGVCSECGEPCCLQPSCSVIREKDGFPMNSAMTV